MKEKKYVGAFICCIEVVFIIIIIGGFLTLSFWLVRADLLSGYERSVE
jgi:hypothetical protein